MSLAKTSSLGSQVSTMEGVSDDDNLQYSRNPPTTAAKTGRIIMKAAGRRTDRSLNVKKEVDLAHRVVQIELHLPPPLNSLVCEQHQDIVN